MVGLPFDWTPRKIRGRMLYYKLLKSVTGNCYTIVSLSIYTAKLIEKSLVVANDSAK